MSILLPLLGLALAIAVAFLGRHTDAPRGKFLNRIIPVGVLMLVACGLAFRFAAEIDRVWMVAGIVIGGVGALLGGRFFGTPATSAAWGIAAAICCQALPDYARPPAQAAAMVALGVGAAFAGAPLAGIAGVSVIAADRLGLLAGNSETLAISGSVMGVAVLIALCLSALKKQNQVVQLAGSVVLVLLGYCLGAFWLKDSTIGAMIALGGLSGAVLHFLIPQDEEPSSLGTGIAAVISVGLATVTFALARGVGMAHALIAAVAILAILGNARALLALGPIVGLVLYRIFRSEHPETSRAFDIGQHYAILGLLIGAILPLTYIDWQKRSLPSLKGSFASALWAILLLGLTPVLVAFFGTYGTIGLIIGFGIAGLMESIRSGSNAGGLSLGAGLSAAILASYPWLSSTVDMTRQEKSTLMIWTAGVALVLLAGIFFLSRRSTDKEIVHEAQ